MATLVGALQKKAPSTYSWDVNGARSLIDTVWQSVDFFYFKLSCSFCFRLNSSNGRLYLCHRGVASFSLNLHLIVEHLDGIEDFSLEKVIKDSTVRGYSEYFLGIVQVQKISAIICKFMSGNRNNDDIFTKGSLTLGENLRDLFLSGEDSDVTIKIGDHEYAVHKAIIKARSPVFHAMMQHNMKEKNEGVVTISDCNPYVFRDFLLFLYSGTLDSNVSVENVFEFYRISDKYDMAEGKHFSVYFIMNNMSVDIFVDVILLATKYDEDKLLSAALKFFSHCSNDILLSENWQKFIVQNPLKANEFLMKVFQNTFENTS